MSDSSPSQPSTSPSIGRRFWNALKWVFKWSFRLIAGILGFVLLLVLLFVIGWQFQSTRKIVTNVGVQVGGMFLDGTLSVGDIRGDLLNTLVVEKVSWKDRKGKPIALLEKLEVQHNAVAFLWTGKIVVKKVRIVRPQAWIEQYKNGKMNVLTHLKLGSSKPKKTPPPPPKKSTGAPLVVEVKSIEISDLFTEFKSPGFTTQVRNFQMQGVFRMVGSKMFFDLNKLSLHNSFPKVGLKNIGLKFAMDGNKMKVSKGRLRLKGGSLIDFKAAMNLGKPMMIDAGITKLKLTPGDIKPIVPSYPVVKDVLLTATAKGKLLKGMKAGVQIKVGKARIDLNAFLNLDKKLYKLDQLAVAAVNAAELLNNPTLKSNLNLKVTGAGVGFAPARMDTTLDVTILPSSFQKYTLDKITTRVRVLKGIATIPRLNIQTPFASIRGARLPKRKVAIWADLNKGAFEARLSGGSRNLARIGRLLKLPLGGAFSFRANLKGEKWMPKGTVRVSLNSIRFQKIRLARLQMSARLNSLKPGISADAFICDPSMTCGKKGIGLRVTPKIKVGRFFTRVKFTMRKGVQRVYLSRFGVDFGAGLFSMRSMPHYKVLSKAPLVTLKGMNLKVNKLGLLWRGRERISVDGRMNLKGRWQNLKVAIRNLSLGPLQRAIGLPYKTRFYGRLSLKTSLKGSFRSPKMGVRLYLSRGRFQKYRNIETCVNLDYRRSRLRVATGLFFPKEARGLRLRRPRLRRRVALRRRRRRSRKRRFVRYRRLALSGQQRRTESTRRRSCLGQTRLPAMARGQRWRAPAEAFWRRAGELPNYGRIRVETALPIRLAITGLPRNPISNTRAMRLSVKVERFQLPWVAGALGLDMAGEANSDISIRGSMSRPVIESMLLDLRNVRYQRMGLFHVRLPFSYKNGKFVCKGGRGFLTPLQYAHHKTGVRKGRVVVKASLFDLSMNIPITVGMRFRGFVPKLQKRLRREPMALRFRLPSRRIHLLRTLLPPKLQKKLSKLSGSLDVLFDFKGNIDKPRLLAQIEWRNGTFCPWLKGKPVCVEPRSFIHKFRRRRIYRLRNLGFLWKMQYSPEQQGNLTMTTRADWGKRKLLRMNLKRLPLKLSIPASLVFNVKKMLPQMLPKRGQDIIDFSLSIPEKMPVGIAERFMPSLDLSKLKGNVALNLQLKGRLSKPRLLVDFDLTEGQYTHEFRSQGRDKGIKGIRQSVRVRYPAQLANGSQGLRFSTTMDLFSKRFMELKTSLGAAVDLYSQLPVGKKKGKLYTLTNPWNGKLVLKPFRLQKIAFFSKSLENIRGVLEGKVQWGGSTACPQFSKDSILRLHSVRMGSQRSDLANQLDFRVEDSSLKLTSLPDGRLQAEAWLKLPERKRERLLLARIWVPFGLKKMMGNFKKLRSCPREERKKILIEAVTRDGLPLSPVAAFVPGYDIMGKVFMDIRLGGTLKNLNVKKGQLLVFHEKLADSSMGLYIGSRGGASRTALCRRVSRSPRRLKSLGCSYTAISIFPKTYRMDMNYLGRTGQPFVIRGQVGHKGFAPTRLNIDILSRGFEPMATKQFRALLKSDVKIRGTAQAPNVSGSMVIPRFFYSLLNTYGGASKYKQDGDIIIVNRNNRSKLAELKARWDRGRAQKDARKKRGQKQEKGVLDKLVLDFVLKIPNNFRINSKLSNKEADIEIKTDSVQNLQILAKNGRLKLIGGIEMVRGGLQAYGKPFTIVKGGTVAFQGQSFGLSNPNTDALLSNVALNIRAYHIVKLSEEAALYKKGLKRVKVYLVIGGTALNPTVEFEVVNAQSEEKLAIDKINAISLILVGNTTDSIGQTNVAGQALGLFGSMLTNQLKSAVADVVPLDVLKVQAGTNLGDFKVAVGWYLSPLLYLELSFKPAPLEEESLWSSRLDYTLNKNWSFEMKAGFTKRNDSYTFRTSGHLYFKTKR